MPEKPRRCNYLVQAKRRITSLDSNVQRLCLLLYEKGHADVDDRDQPLSLAIDRAKHSAIRVQAAFAKLEMADATHWEAARVILEDAWEDVGDAICGVMRRIANTSRCEAETSERSAARGCSSETSYQTKRRFSRDDEDC